jgi:hypothetical protein
MEAKGHLINKDGQTVSRKGNQGMSRHVWGPSVYTKTVSSAVLKPQIFVQVR